MPFSLIAAFFLSFLPLVYAAQVSLIWDPNSEPDLAGYRIHYGFSSQKYYYMYDVGKQTSYTFSRLENGRTYFLALTAYDYYGNESNYSNEVSFPTAPVNSQYPLIAGLGTFTADGGWVEGFADDQSHASWIRVDWPDYNKLNGETRVATGDIDGDRKDEMVIGYGPAPGNSMIPAGWFELRDDDEVRLAWGQIEFEGYNTTNGETWPACGDVDGDGEDEIIVGLGPHPSAGGWLEVFDYSPGKVSHKAWIRVDHEPYNSRNGETRPTSGDIDGDGRDEIIVGLGLGGGGRLEIFDDALGGYARIGTAIINWSAYNQENGETWPACGDVDGDGRDEVIVGFGHGGDGWLELFDYEAGSLRNKRWRKVAWEAYNSQSGETRPACGDLDDDGRDEIAVGVGQGGDGWVEILDDAFAGYAVVGWAKIEWEEYNTGNGETRPAVKK